MARNKINLILSFKALITSILFRGQHSHAWNTREEELYPSPTTDHNVCGRPCKWSIHGQKGYLIPYHQIESSFFLSGTSLCNAERLLFFVLIGRFFFWSPEFSDRVCNIILGRTKIKARLLSLHSSDLSSLEGALN